MLISALFYPPASEGEREGGGSRGKRETVEERKGEAGEVLRLCLAAMLGKCQWCYHSLREGGREGERERV